MSGLAVFTGPSLPAAHAAAALPTALIEPPAGRGDLDRVCAAGAQTIVLIDGVFAHRLAVPPSEVVRALRAGVRLVGAASLGALRAAECRPAGAEGIGAVFCLCRWRVITDDDEVAVAVEPDRDHRAASVALINVRFAALEALRRGWLDRAGARRLLTAARRQHFSERHWPGIFAGAGLEPAPALRALCEGTDVKRRDAERALARVAREPWRGAARSAGERRPPPAIPVRYPGHDPWLGISSQTARSGLVRWLLASGRYRRFCAEHRADEAPEKLWAALADAGELDGELLRWYAVTEGAREGEGAPASAAVAAAQRVVAREHGFGDWHALEGAGDRYAVPLAWAREAADALARARHRLGVPPHVPE